MKNKNYKIIDSHAHIFPGKIAKKAVSGIGSFYGLEITNSGEPDKLEDECIKNNIYKVLVTSTATKPEQVKPINDFLIEVSGKHDIFFPFGTLSPLMSDYDIDCEIERMIENSFFGVKLHPDFQNIKADSYEIIKICRKVAGKLPVLIHAGDDRFDNSNPDRIRNLIENSSEKLTLVAAHLGGYTKWDEAVKLLSDFPNLYVDTSSSLKYMTSKMGVDVINAFGYDKVLFGTDFPMWNHGEEIERILELDLPENALRKIFFDNANRLFFSSSL